MKKIACLLLLFQCGIMMAQQKETVATINGKKIQVDPNAVGTADNGLTATNGNVQLGGTLIKATSLVTSSSATLALQGLQSGANTDNILVVDTNGIIKSIARTSFGDNLGNHIAVQDLNMNANNIIAVANITATGKTSSGTVAITKGTDGSNPQTGYLAAAADEMGNVKWSDISKLLPKGSEGQVLSLDASGNVTWVTPVGSKDDATRYLGGTVYTGVQVIVGGIIPLDRVIGKALGTTYTVGAVTATSAKGGIMALKGNGYTISNPSQGIFDIKFDVPLTEIYGISTNIVDAFTGSNNVLDPDKAGNTLATTDNTQVAFISNSIIRVKTGNANGLLSNRPFTFLVSGK